MNAIDSSQLKGDLRSHGDRTIYFDVLNIVACFCVIALHCNGIAHVFSDSLAWKQALLVEVVAYWAVPVFFMLSGATLMNYRNKYNTKTFLLRRLTRVGIPFIAWTLINIVFKQAIGVIDVLEMDIQGTIAMCMNASVEPVYWFFVPLFSVYLCVPVLSILANQKKLLWYVVIVAMALKSIGPYLWRWIGIDYNNGLDIPVASGYIMYFILGYLLSITDFTKRQRILIYTLGIGGAAFRYIGTVYYSYAMGSLDNRYFSYFGFFAAFLAVAVFVFAKNVRWEKLFSKEIARKAISSIAGCSFGIYLIHMIVYRIGSVVLHMNLEVWQGRIFGPFIIYAICLATILLLKRIPVVRKIVP